MHPTHTISTLKDMQNSYIDGTFNCFSLYERMLLHMVSAVRETIDLVLLRFKMIIKVAFDSISSAFIKG